DPSGANAFDNASHRYEITVSAALALPPIDAVAWTQLCSHASPPRLGQQSPHHLLGLFQPDGATLFVKVSGDSPIVVGFIGSHVQVISNPLHPSPQHLVLFAPPLGLGASGVTLLLQRLDAVQKRQGGLNGQRQGGLNDAPLIRTRRGLRGDAAQLLQAVMSHVSHYASPRALARTSHNQAFANSSSNQQLGSSSDSRIVAARYLVAALMSSRTTPDS